MSMLRNYRELSTDELAEIIRLYPVTPNRKLARQFSISVDALVDNIAGPRGLKKDKKALYIGNRGGKSLTADQVAWLFVHFKHTKNEDIIQKFGIGESQLHRVARKYGLKKSMQYMKKTQQNTTDHAVAACRRYGIYEETRERMRKRMQELIARGERLPGGFKKGETNLQRIGPKRERERIEKVRITRNETIRKDRLRIRWGLPQKSKLRLTFSGYDSKCKKKTNYRHLFRKFNYIVERGSDDIYYDDLTERHLRMENSAEKYGLKFIEAIDYETEEEL